MDGYLDYNLTHAYCLKVVQYTIVMLSRNMKLEVTWYNHDEYTPYTYADLRQSHTITHFYAIRPP